ncbi:MAG: Smr/MutS family protein [Candidatus Doudnabacteria bacterium]|nr:Smr/MutS family protein [Candidatus Doudnabacteria bacterium]
MGEDEGSPNPKELLLQAAEAKRYKNTLDLHGLDVEAAGVRIDQYLYGQFTAGQRFCRIMHGKGTGKLRQSTLDLLAGHPLVEAFRSSTRPEEQGAVIYVVLQENVSEH